MSMKEKVRKIYVLVTILLIGVCVGGCMKGKKDAGKDAAEVTADLNGDGVIDEKDKESFKEYLANRKSDEKEDEPDKKSDKESDKESDVESDKENILDNVKKKNSNEELFYQYVDENLIVEYGLTRTYQTGIMTNEKDVWMQPRGILSAEIADLDNDGETEMLLVYVKYVEKNVYKIVLDVYEVKEQSVILASSMDYGAYYNTGSGTINIIQHMGYEFNISLADKGENKYIVCEVASRILAFTDATYCGSWILQYDGSSLNYVASFTQTAGGSSGFVFTGFYFEDGKCVKDEVLLGDPLLYDDLDPLYDDFEYYDKAAADLFAKYGIRLNDSFEMYLEGSILAVDESVERIMNFKTQMTDSDYMNNKYEFQLDVTDYTAVRSKISSHDDYGMAYADLLFKLYAANDISSDLAFQLGYIDEDDIPELFVTYSADFHAANVHVYTYYNGEVCDLGGYGEYGVTSYAPRQNIIVSNWMGHGQVYEKYYKIESGKNVEVANFHTDIDQEVLDNSSEVYEYNGNFVTEEEYENQLKKYKDTYRYAYAGYGDDFHFSELNMIQLCKTPLKFINPKE